MGSRKKLGRRQAFDGLVHRLYSDRSTCFAAFVFPWVENGTGVMNLWFLL